MAEYAWVESPIGWKCYVPEHDLTATIIWLHGDPLPFLGALYAGGLVDRDARLGYSRQSETVHGAMDAMNEMLGTTAKMLDARAEAITDEWKLAADEMAGARAAGMDAERAAVIALIEETQAPPRP